MEERQRLEQTYVPQPEEVLQKGKRAGAKVQNFFKAFARQLYLCVRNPARVPKGIASGCRHLGHELVHYYQGFKLFCADINTANFLLIKFIKTGKVSWREKRQLNRAFADTFRLVPMAVFLLVPLFEFLLPLALKLFPNMLPSQFHKTDLKEASLKKELKMRIRTAAFLQDAIFSSIKNNKLKDEATDLVQLLETVRTGGRVSNTDIKKVAHLFTDELAIDNLPRTKLSAMCRMVGMRPLGPTILLRKQLVKKLKQLHEDDIEISRIGVDYLTYDELLAACRERGMRTLGLTPSGYRRNLKAWISLSTESDIPASLLLLSRAFVLLERNPNPNEILKKAVQDCEGGVDEIMFDAGVMDPAKKVQFIADQNKRIREEKIEEESGPKDQQEEIARIAEELEQVISDPYTGERETLRRLKGLESANKANADIQPQAMAAAAAIDLQNVPAEDDPTRETLFLRRMRERLKRTFDSIEKKIEIAEEQSLNKDMPCKLDEDRDGRVSKEEIINVLTKTLVEFEGDPTEAEKVAVVLSERCGDFRGEISVNEILSIAKEIREKELEGMEITSEVAAAATYEVSKGGDEKFRN
eukprot:CAMPEP_0167760652 /NCGR_PEP_ID=MMETSP0110_2-20121227/11704_1 /TAXON_ID=629695 /ORGANISM="Gymnochlora sp., Strain CCMP2014" /LENGTH=584 /DNA_ID=CAMNT_0007647185 /DNA_START=442 /DNA_END=2196 /DNA_ORIENTATION=+